MAKQPQGTVPSDKGVESFYNILANAYAESISTLSKADTTTATRRRQTARQIEQIFSEADEDVKAWVKVEIPAFYEMGMFEGTKQLSDRGSTIRLDKSFSTFHKEAIEVISQDTYQSIAEGMTGIKKTTDRILSQGARESILERIQKGQIYGDARQKINADIREILKNEGITALRDRSGREWDLLDYARMLSRTKLTQAHNSGLSNRMVESGYDLVIVSDHFGTCPQCAPFERMILSLTGRSRGFTTLREAERGGLFHPNCRHTFSPYHDKYLDESVAWDTRRRKYVSYGDLTPTEFQKTNLKKADYVSDLIKAGVGAHKTMTVYRAVDSTSGDAVLGSGKYVAFKKENVERYGKKIEEYVIDPSAKMLQLPDGTSLDRFVDTQRKNYPELFAENIEKYGAEKGNARFIREVATRLGYDGIISDDEAFGTVVFNEKNLLPANAKNLSLLNRGDIAEYEKAYTAGDVKKLEALRKLNPTDARFNLHLQYASIEDARQQFKDVLAEHKDILSEVGIPNIGELHKIIESGNKKKLSEALAKLPDKHPLKDPIERLLKFL